MTNSTVYLLPIWVIMLILLAGTLAFTEVGYRIGRRLTQDDDRVNEALGIVQNSVLGLMAFLLAFTFSLAGNRYEIRHDLEQKEANCMGTAWLRTDLVQGEPGKAMKKLFPAYVQARLTLYEAGIVDPSRYQPAKKKSDDITAQLWAQAVTAAAMDAADKRTPLVLQSINDMIDAGGDVEEARRHHVPPITFILLYVAVLLSGGFIGYGFGRAGARSWTAWIIFGLLTVFTIGVIHDLERPERGFIRNDHVPISQVLDSMR